MLNRHQKIKQQPATEESSIDRKQLFTSKMIDDDNRRLSSIVKDVWDCESNWKENKNYFHFLFR